MQIDTKSAPSVTGGQAGVRYGAALSLLTTVFFMWGFATVLNDVLVPHLKSAFSLSYTASLLVQFCFYIGYLVISLPAAKLIARIGYKNALVTGLLGMAAGCLIFIPASGFFSYGLFLLALFVLAGAITLLQVAANPYVVVIGPKESATGRLNLVQAFNSLGTTVAPLFGGFLIFGRSASGHSDAAETLQQRMADAQAVQLPYLIIAAVLVVLALVVWRFPLPQLGRQSVAETASLHDGSVPSVWRHRNLLFGVPAIFLYMICEIGIGSTLVNFIAQPTVGNMSHLAASGYVSLFWGGAMVGRFLGAGILRRISPHTALAVVSASGALLVVIAAFATGHIAMWALILTGLCHSIMFPTIFALGVQDLGARTEEGSGYLIMAIVGGAAAIIQGVLADHVGLALSYLLPGVCYLYLLFYAIWGSKPVLR